MVLDPFVVTPVIPEGAVQAQLKVTLGVELDNVTAEVVAPEHMVWLGAENVTTGDGLTVML